MQDHSLGDIVCFTKHKKQYKGIVRKIYISLYEIELSDGFMVRVPKKKVINSQLQINLFE